MILHKRITAEQMRPRGTSFLAAWIFFQITANHIFLPVLVITFLFSKRASRHPAVINVCLTWIMSGIMSSILFYVGRENGADPRSGVCIAQASLTSGIAPMTTTALLILVIHLSMSLSPYWQTASSRRTGFSFNPALLGLPYLVFGLFTSIGVGLAIEHPDQVSREQKFFYCSLDWSAFTDAVTIISALVCLTTVGLEVRVWLLLSEQWHRVRRDKGIIDVDLIVRTSVFTGYLLISTLINLAANWSQKLQQSVAPDMVSASVGMALFFILGSHKNVLTTWEFWKQHPANSSSHPPSQTLVSDRTSTFLQMPALERGGSQRDTSSSHTFESESLSKQYSRIKQYYEGEIGPQTSNDGNRVIVIQRPEEAFGGYVRDRDRTEFVLGDEPIHYIPATPPPRERMVTAVTALEYDHDGRVSSLRGSWI